jgi:hypothetical protein
MTRSAGPLFACALALLSAQANAQAGATPQQRFTTTPINRLRPSNRSPGASIRLLQTTFVGHWSKPPQRTASPSNFSLA